MNLLDFPVYEQRQDSVLEQLADLELVANRVGCYDAAEIIRQWVSGSVALPEVKYGCHVDLAEGDEPDGCVLDVREHDKCIFAKPGMRKEQCQWWRPIHK